MQYRRAFIQGGCYFFTVNLADRRSTLLTDNIAVLRSVINDVKHKHPFILDAMVVLPDHLHAIWTLPPGDAYFERRWMLIKSAFSRHIPKTEKINKSRKHKGERGIWQRRYWEHVIRNHADYEKHVDYIHYNPVKHGHVNHVQDWPYSTVHDYINKGILMPDWGLIKHQYFAEAE